jgi:uncharacterized repeat protein (TIGR04052 family)
MAYRGLAALALGVAACGPAQGPVAIRFAAVAQGAPLACNVSRETSLTDLRFFIHDVALLMEDGQSVPVTLDAAAPWQNDMVALVDLEDATGACETGSPATHAVVTGRAARGRVAGLRFTVGVPFAANHADPALATPPLDQTAMHWHWQAGYKFLRAGVKHGEQQSFLHLGSTGCAGRIGQVTGCAKTNRVTVTLAGFDPAKDVVGIDLGNLFGESQDAGACQSEPDNANCVPLFKAMGLGDSPQQVFRRVAPG